MSRLGNHAFSGAVFKVAVDSSCSIFSVSCLFALQLQAEQLAVSCAARQFANPAGNVTLSTWTLREGLRGKIRGQVFRGYGLSVRRVSVVGKLALRAINSVEIDRALIHPLFLQSYEAAGDNHHTDIECCKDESRKGQAPSGRPIAVLSPQGNARKE